MPDELKVKTGKAGNPGNRARRCDLGRSGDWYRTHPVIGDDRSRRSIAGQIGLKAVVVTGQEHVEGNGTHGPPPCNATTYLALAGTTRLSDYDPKRSSHAGLLVRSPANPTMTCPFCRIGAGELEAVVLYADEEVVAFLDIGPIRPGHTQIIPRQHVATFEELPEALAARILHIGQRLARRLKAVYGVERVAFLFTGGDVPHAHAHVVPMHEKADITSARYLVGPSEPRWGSAHLHTDRAALLRVREDIAFAPAGARASIASPAS